VSHRKIKKWEVVSKRNEVSEDGRGNTARRETIHRMWEWGQDDHDQNNGVFGPNPAPKTKAKLK